MIKIALCDDSEQALQILEEYTDRMKQEMICKKYICAKTLIRDMETQEENFDIYVLDIEMPGKDGMVLGKEIRDINKNAIIIFQTSHTELVFESFKIQAFRFLQKPVKYEDFQEAVLSAIRLVKEKNTCFIFSYEKQNYQLQCNEILYIEKRLRKITIHTTVGEYASYMSMNEVMDQLDMDVFVRSNVSYILNMAYIKGITRDTVHMGEGITLPISKNYRKQVQKKHLQYEMVRV